MDVAILRFTALRKRAKVSMGDVAKIAGVECSTLARWEKGTYQMRPGSFALIRAALAAVVNEKIAAMADLYDEVQGLTPR